MATGAGPRKYNEGLSELAKLMLEMAGDQLTKKEKRELWSMRQPATLEEVEGYLTKVMAELKAKTPMKNQAERRRLELLKELNEKADKREEEERERKRMSRLRQEDHLGDGQES